MHYSGTVAALVNWGPWSVLVVTAHFTTLFGCQEVITLGTQTLTNVQKVERKMNVSSICVTVVCPSSGILCDVGELIENNKITPFVDEGWLHPCTRRAFLGNIDLLFCHGDLEVEVEGLKDDTSTSLDDEVVHDEGDIPK
eukprot:15216271-Ditylum_brightwellii.AAC.1